MPDDETLTADAQQTENAETPPEKTFNESEVTALVAKEKAKAARAERTRIEAEQTEKERQATQTAEQKAQADRDAAQQRADDAEAKANAKIVRADAKTAAAALGFRADRVTEVLQFADLTDIEVSDDGDADAKAIEAALKPLLKRFPEWTKAETTNIGGGFNSGTETIPPVSIIPENNRKMNAAFRGALRRR